MRLAPVNGHDILNRTSDFADRIIKLHAAIPKHGVGKNIAAQLVRSGTSIGAQIAEANFAKSQADFVSKLQGALQESEETRFWIKRLVSTGLIKAARLDDILRESSEITAIIVTIVNKSRGEAK